MPALPSQAPSSLRGQYRRPQLAFGPGARRPAVEAVDMASTRVVKKSDSSQISSAGFSLYERSAIRRN